MRQWVFLFWSFFIVNINLAQDSSIPDSIWKSVVLEDVVVTAQYTPTDIRNAVHNVTVIKAVEILEQGQNNLAEVLINQLNLSISTDPILGNGLGIQGLGGEHIQIMIDGVPIIGRVGGNIDLSQVNLNNVDRIEIIRGAMSAQYGSNASGGVINIITKKSQLSNFEIESTNQYESINFLNNAMRIGYRSKNIFASVNLSRLDYRFEPVDSMRLTVEEELPDGDTRRIKKHPWNPKIQYGIDATLRYQFNDSLKFTYQYRRFDEELSIYGEVRRPQFLPYARDEIFFTDRLDHSINAEAYLGPELYLNSTTAYNQYGRINRVERYDFDNDSTSLIPNEQDTTLFETFLHRSILSTSSSRPLNLQIGLEILAERGSGERIIDTSASDPNLAVLNNYAAWLGLNYKVNEKLTLLANFRYGYNSKYDHPLIPSFHLNWKAHQSLDLKLSYAKGFRAPSLKELHFNFIDINHFIVGNPNLKAEYSDNASLNFDHRLALNREQTLRTSLSLFYNYIGDQIVLAEFEDNKFNYQNLDQFQTHGLNLEFVYKMAKKLSVRSGFAYTCLFNPLSDDFDTDKFTGLSEWKSTIEYSIPYSKVRLVFAHQYIGRQIRFFEDSEGLLQRGFIGDHHFINATLSRSFFRNRVFMAFGVKNIGNTQRIPVSGSAGAAHSGGTASRLINWGRTYFFKLNLTLSK